MTIFYLEKKKKPLEMENNFLENILLKNKQSTNLLTKGKIINIFFPLWDFKVFFFFLGVCFESKVKKFGSEKLYSNNKTYQGNNCQPFVRQSSHKRNWFWNATSFQKSLPRKKKKKKNPYSETIALTSWFSPL